MCNTIESGLDKFKRQVEEISYLASNEGWPKILASFYDISDAADGAMSGRRNKRCTCPIHGTHKKDGKGDGFRFLKNGVVAGTCACNSCGYFPTGFKLIQAVDSCSFSDAVKRVSDYFNYYENDLTEEEQEEQRKQLKIRQEKRRIEKMHQEAIKLKEDEKAKVIGLNKLKKMWGESFDLEDERSQPARNYFLKRGLGRVGNLNDEVRFHPNLPFYSTINDGETDKPAKLGNFPAIISQIRNPEGMPVAIHRTYINFQGYKLDLNREFLPNGITFEQIEQPEIKKMTAAIPLVDKKGGAIQISRCGTKILAVGEGLETTLAVAAATGMPVTCCINATMLADWIPAQGTKYVFIFKDKDVSRTGEIQAEALRKRLEPYGIEIFDFEPPFDIPDGEKGVDWADVLKNFGKEAFPQEAVNWKELI